GCAAQPDRHRKTFSLAFPPTRAMGADSAAHLLLTLPHLWSAPVVALAPTALASCPARLWDQTAALVKAVDCTHTVSWAEAEPCPQPRSLPADCSSFWLSRACSR